MNNTVCFFNVVLIKDIILIVSSITTIVISFYGLNKWKKEHKGKLRYELSRNVLKAVLNLRESFKEIRNPMMWPHELSSEHGANARESEKWSYLFNKRLKSIQSDCNEFSTFLPEVEIEFDKETNSLCNELTDHFRKQHRAISEYIQLVDNCDQENPRFKKVYNVVFNDSDDNETTIAFNKTIDALKEKLSKEMQSI